MKGGVRVSLILLMPIIGIKPDEFLGSTSSIVEPSLQNSSSSIGEHSAWVSESTQRSRDSRASSKFAIKTAYVDSPLCKENDWMAYKLCQEDNSYLLLARKPFCPAEPLSTSSIEEICRIQSEHELIQIYPEVFRDASAGIPWISRTLWATEENVVPRDWLHSRSEELSPETTAALRCAKAIVGWGNNVLIGKDFPIEQLLTASCAAQGEAGPAQLFIDGLVDAQTFWITAETLSKDAIRLVLEQRDIEDSKQIHRINDRSDQIVSCLAHSNAVFNEYNTITQGIRRDVACTQLQAWNYSELRSSIRDRLDDADELHQRRQRRSDARYHNLVEVILYVLGSLNVVSLVLALFQTALSGNVDAAPYGLVVNFLQSISLDGGLLLSLVLIVLMILLYARAHRGE